MWQESRVCRGRIVMGKLLSFAETPLAGLRVMRRTPLRDDRGLLERLYCAEELAPVLAGRTINQINRTLTLRRGTVRGMHFQRPPASELKLVTCLQGEVFDVAVDVRDGSPTFLRWHAALLSPDNFQTMIIPEGFAHGFQALTDNCELLYFHSASYSPESEGALNARDPRLRIDWPLEISEMSLRDASHCFVTSDFRGVVQ